MSGSDPGGPNWSRVFDSARRRIFWRVLLVVGIGAVGAALLTTSSFVANGTIPVALNNHKDPHETGPGNTAPPPTPPPPRPGPTGGNPPRPGAPRPPKPNTLPPADTKVKCNSEKKLTDSASTEYEDCPPAKIEAAWSEESQTSTGEVATESPPSDSASLQK
jgi:hypothetical protein